MTQTKRVVIKVPIDLSNKVKRFRQESEISSETFMGFVVESQISADEQAMFEPPTKKMEVER
jgi:hypothetical protein